MAAPVFLDIKDVAGTHVSRSTVGQLDRSGDIVTSLGTSTFIRFGDVSGLLTCAHVVHAIEQRARQGLEHIGIVMFPARENAIQNTMFQVRSLNMVRIGNPPFDEAGPDVGFIGLAPNHLSTLNAQASIVDGDAQSDRSRTDQPQTQCIEVVAGVVAEWIVYRLQFLGHRVEPYAALAAG